MSRSGTVVDAPVSESEHVTMTAGRRTSVSTLEEGDVHSEPHDTSTERKHPGEEQQHQGRPVASATRLTHRRGDNGEQHRRSSGGAAAAAGGADSPLITDNASEGNDESNIKAEESEGGRLRKKHLYDLTLTLLEGINFGQRPRCYNPARIGIWMTSSGGRESKGDRRTGTGGSFEEELEAERILLHMSVRAFQSRRHVRRRGFDGDNKIRRTDWFSGPRLTEGESVTTADLDVE
ncbi:unnamed protein product [Rangifer tarandus platyrhynchus]|uniref:Uncharacterized protein n=1 Tax=Rangifer tarandus platyrhynchus TaxID=3082113 RepID=A0ABN8XJ36_RANTA|nr:unnamed protein product [Rangifer tarandus platyrhynchus]